MDVLWNLPMLILRTEERPMAFVGLNLVNVFTTIAFNIYFVVYAKLGIIGVFYGNIVASTLMLMFSFPIVYQRLRFKYISKTLLKKILYFGLPFIPAGIFTMVMELADRYLLEWMVGTSAVGIYSAGYKLGMFGLLLVMGFTMGWTPFFLKKGKDDQAPEMFSRIITYFLGIYGFVAVFFTLIIDDLVKINVGDFSFFGEAFWSATNIVPVIFLAYFFFGLYVLQLPAVYLPEKTKWIPLFRFVGAITNVVLNILVIPTYGVMGAALATMGAQAIMALSIYLKSRKDYKIPFRQIGIIFPLFAMIGAIFLDGSMIIKFMYLSGYFILWIFIVADKTEQNFIFRRQL
jgi:O-antigen/teichoic acid export membrane protein